MKPFIVYLLVLSSTTAGVIIVGSWLAIESRPQSRYTGSRSEVRLHGVRRALGQDDELGSLLETGPGLALSSSNMSQSKTTAQDVTVRAQGLQRQGSGFVPLPWLSDASHLRAARANAGRGEASLPNGVTLRRDEGFANDLPRAGCGVVPRPAGSAGHSQGVRPERQAGGYLMAAPPVGLPDLASSAARLCGVPEPILFALISRESSWRQDVKGRTLRSSHGALGLTQIKASTAHEVSPTLDPHEPFGNLLAGACYLRRQFDRFGDWGIALKAYRVGPNSPALHSKTARDYSDAIMERGSN